MSIFVVSYLQPESFLLYINRCRCTLDTLEVVLRKEKPQMISQVGLLDVTSGRTPDVAMYPHEHQT